VKSLVKNIVYAVSIWSVCDKNAFFIIGVYRKKSNFVQVCHSRNCMLTVW